MTRCLECGCRTDLVLFLLLLLFKSSFRNSGVTIAVNDPGMERKLNRTRKMSENIRTVESKTMTTIPTQKEDITLKWIHMIINQAFLKCGKAPIDRDTIEGMKYEIIDCKSR